MNLTDGANFTTPLVKGAKTIVNQKIKFPRDTKGHIREILIINGWNTHIVHILHEIHNVNTLFGGNLINRIPKTVELTHKCIKKIFNYPEPDFFSLWFDESEKWTL